jgi:hypothetical protein
MVPPATGSASADGPAGWPEQAASAIIVAAEAAARARAVRFFGMGRTPVGESDAMGPDSRDPGPRPDSPLGHGT